MFVRSVRHSLFVIVVLALLPLASLATASQPEYSLTLVREGQPTSALVLAVNATRAAQFAALELQEHVRLISGATLPIVTDPSEAAGVRIYVGESPSTRRMGLRSDTFGVQEYLVRFLPDALVLMGRDAEDYGRVDYTSYHTFPALYSRHATEYAVYDFLERYCDVRWYRPGPLGTEYPETKTLTVSGGEVRRKPGFSYIESCMWNVGDARNFDDQTRLWLKTDPEAKAAEALLYGDIRKAIPNDFQYGMELRRIGQLFQHRRRMGGEKFGCGHAFYGYLPRFWKDPNATEQDKRFEADHPDWFAQGWTGKPSQMCYTNKGFIAQVVQDARNYFDGKTPLPYGIQAGGDFFGLGTMDNGSYCQCAECQAWFNPEAAKDGHFTNGKWSDYVWNFSNQVAREMAKTHPDKYLSQFAYASYAMYPTKVKPEPNIAVELCLHLRNWWCPTMRERDLRVVNDWTGDGSGRPAYVYGYWSFPAEIAHSSGNAWYCFPEFLAHESDWQMKYFKERGIRGFFVTLAPGPDGYFNLKLMEDPEADIDEVIDDYFMRFYGNAGEPMKQLYLAIEKAVSTPANYPDWVLNSPSGMHQNAEIAWGHLGTAERMAEFAQLMTKARLAARTPKEKARVKLFEQEIWSYMLAGRKVYAAQESVERPQVKAAYLEGSPAAGDPTKVDWAKATPLGSFVTASGAAPPREIAGRIAHDGKWLYLQLVDPVDPKLLMVNNDTLAAADDWEIFWAPQRMKPYYQLITGPTGASAALVYDPLGTYEYGVSTFKTGVKVVSDVNAPDRWVTNIAMPLADLLPAGVKRGDLLYFNIFRNSKPGGTKFYYWSATFGGPHELRRMGEISIE